MAVTQYVLVYTISDSGCTGKEKYSKVKYLALLLARSNPKWGYVFRNWHLEYFKYKAVI